MMIKSNSQIQKYLYKIVIVCISQSIIADIRLILEGN